MALQFKVSAGNSIPIYRQVVDQVRKAVASGSLVEGDQLPSVRALAEQLVINPNTVTRAYGELVRDGMVEARQGKGLFIVKRRQMFTRDERLRRVNQAMDLFLNEVLFLDFSLKEIQTMLERKASKDQLMTPSESKKGDAHE